jgi:hypothetical protein
MGFSRLTQPISDLFGRLYNNSSLEPRTIVTMEILARVLSKLNLTEGEDPDVPGASGGSVKSVTLVVDEDTVGTIHVIDEAVTSVAVVRNGLVEQNVVFTPGLHRWTHSVPLEIGEVITYIYTIA